MDTLETKKVSKVLSYF